MISPYLFNIITEMTMREARDDSIPQSLRLMAMNVNNAKKS